MLKPELAGLASVMNMRVIMQAGGRADGRVAGRAGKEGGWWEASSEAADIRRPQLTLSLPPLFASISICDRERV